MEANSYSLENFLFGLGLGTIENKFSSVIMQPIITVMTCCTIIVVIDHRIHRTLCTIADNGLLKKIDLACSTRNQTRKYTLMEYQATCMSLGH